MGRDWWRPLVLGEVSLSDTLSSAWTLLTQPLRSPDLLIPIGFLVFVRVERLGGKKAGPKKAKSER